MGIMERDYQQYKFRNEINNNRSYRDERKNLKTGEIERIGDNG